MIETKQAVSQGESTFNLLKTKKFQGFLVVGLFVAVLG